MNDVVQLVEELKSLGDPQRAQNSQRYFKTAKDEYGEGDTFLGIRVPVLRAFVKKYKQTKREDALVLLKSDYHEIRLTAIFFLVNIYQKGDTRLKKMIFEDYLANVQYINNWDIVDSSAPQIVGHYLNNKDRSILKTLAQSSSLWERRMSIIATLYFIRHYDFQSTLDISEILLHDKEDLIHKGVGWMLRECGNKSQSTEEIFLKKYYKEMPRTMLRYAIEKFPETLRQAYLKSEI
jgi:3-methyladenine DNA glycosylase AlkD